VRWDRIVGKGGRRQRRQWQASTQEERQNERCLLRKERWGMRYTWQGVHVVEETSPNG